MARCWMLALLLQGAVVASSPACGAKSSEQSCSAPKPKRAGRSLLQRHATNTLLLKDSDKAEEDIAVNKGAEKTEGDIALRVETKKSEGNATIQEDSGKIGGSVEVRSKPSCVDEAEYVPITPKEADQNANPYNVEMKCAYDVTWPISDFILDLMERHHDDPDDFRFKVCWNKDDENLFRKFPWLYANTGDWKHHHMAEFHVVINPKNLEEIWEDGYQQVMPDALDYFARMGEIHGRIIIPRFMMYGWSKGATYNWPLGRWRSDIVQGVVAVSGCESKKYYTKDQHKKAKKEGVVPYFFMSSALDGYVDCTHGDTLDRHAKQKQNALMPDLQVHVSYQCGHHPERCWPSCDYEAVYYTPFWDWVSKAYNHTGCHQWTSADTCADYLCSWDDELGTCDMAFPSKLVPSCERFCTRELVDSCEEMDETACDGSYRILSVEGANAKGMHAACYWSGGKCLQKVTAFQCFFQDQCP